MGIKRTLCVNLVQNFTRDGNEWFLSGGFKRIFDKFCARHKCFFLRRLAGVMHRANMNSDSPLLESKFQVFFRICSQDDGPIIDDPLQCHIKIAFSYPFIAELEMKDHDRIVLLFDLDCFYAQCERVRLGLDKDAKLALLQWNSALAVTYPARAYGIKRGDSWETVAQKSNGACHAIHLHILEAGQQPTSNNDSNHNNNNDDDHADNHTDNIQVAFEKIYKLSPEQQLEARKDLGKQRFHYEGKACLERYRLASMRIFTVVLESLTKHLRGKDQFVLERASIDEFYLDISKFCYDHTRSTYNEDQPTTDASVVVGDSTIHTADNSSVKDALHKACQVSHWIRNDVWNSIGFTMSAGISTNKVMAKLAASFGKPNGQAVLHPLNFGNLMKTTKIQKVRHFGGKLGREVIRKVLKGNEGATMGDLAQVPLPLLQHCLSEETAQFVYSACRGMDREVVKETAGALVKSITAFKSFTATSNQHEIEKWLDIIVGEIVSRVSKDTARNKRYPKCCTLNYTYYTTSTGKRPTDGSHRSQRNTRSVRLDYPNEKHPQKAQAMKQQAMSRLLPILAKHPLRGVGLSTNNFETRGQPPAGVASIDNFFAAATANPPSATMASNTTMQQQSKTIMSKQNEKTNLKSSLPGHQIELSRPSTIEKDLEIARKLQASLDQEQCTTQQYHGDSRTKCKRETTGFPISAAEKDMELAKQLQASFDREHYVLTAGNRRSSTTVQQGRPAKKKPRRIDAFFKRS